LKVAFERSAKAYLPELSAYLDYLKKHHPDIKTFDTSELDDYNPMDFDVVWRFMGMDRHAKGRHIIHEYGSLSTPPFPRLKNKIKKLINARPDGRIFLNEDVKAGFSFNDDIPSSIRDMGVDPSFYVKGAKKPEYDFVYAGSLERGAVVWSFLKLFEYALKPASLLVVGNVPNDINAVYGNADNITFTGGVAYKEVASYLAKGRYGVNLTPDTYPFNRQAATKVLEYSAVGLPVITPDCHWVQKFASEKEARFFIVRPDMENLTLENLEAFDFRIPHVAEDTWDEVISRSGIFNLLPS
jgi:glycosyltransferase involved in cell wall biosynthesis